MREFPDLEGPLEQRVQSFAGLLLRRLAQRCGSPPRTYGFEYEWISRRPMSPADLDRVVDYLVDVQGFRERDGQLVLNRRRIVFEPGGQIEFLSPPLPPGDSPELDELLDWIVTTLGELREEAGVEYVAQGHMPGREDAPLLLRDVRYTSMHERFESSGRLGRQMMKGTAAVHLHAALLDPGELPVMFGLFRELVDGPLAMSPARREIWCSTDDCRCGLPPVPPNPQTPMDVLEPMVLQAMKAVELRTVRPFRELPCGSFEVFLNHFTTIFTDIRLNLKGATLELRTQDSLPPGAFHEAWKLFTASVEKALPAD